jgi:hypothetical protein
MDQWEEDQIRQRELERVGWIIWHVRGSDFYRDPDGALAELWHILDGLKITPRHTWESERRQAAQDSMDHDRSSPPDTSSENDSIFQDDEDGSQDEVAQEEAYTIADDGGDHLVLGSEHVGSRRRRPEAMPPLMIQNAILQSLQKCANHTCTVKSLTSRVLKELGVTTRGNPRLEFEKRVMRNLGAMKRKALVTEYKAKNKRIRLLGSPPETGLFE